MSKVIIPLLILFLLVIAAKVIEQLIRKRKPEFVYRRKDGAMTAAERECFHALV